MKDDEVDAVGGEDRKGENCNGKNNERKRKEEHNKVDENGYKGINIVFTKYIYKIMFDIQAILRMAQTDGGQPKCQKCKAPMFLSQGSRTQNKELQDTQAVPKKVDHQMPLGRVCQGREKCKK